MSDSDRDAYEPDRVDSVTEVTTQSWGSRLGGGLWSILFGLLLVVVTGVVLFWNEGRAVDTANSLTEGASSVIAIQASPVIAANDGKLVHLSGSTASSQDIVDADLGVAAKGLALKRTVEMYQWVEKSTSETRKSVGGSDETVTRYTYDRAWSTSTTASSGFKEPRGHENPSFPNLGGTTIYARDATLGGFALNERILAGLSTSDAPTISASAGQRAAEYFGKRTTLTPGTIYAGANPGSPQVGDIRITYAVAPNAPISVVAKQSQATLAPYATRNGREILLVSAGVQDPATMFAGAQSANVIVTWVVRVLGILGMLFGFRMMLNLLSVIGDVIPFIGDIIGIGAWFVAIACTLVVAPIIIAVAWLVARPLVALGAIAVAIAAMVGMRLLSRRSPARVATA